MKVNHGARRFDIGEMRAATRTPQGFLMVPAFVTRPGVFPYRMANGEVRYELRHPDDVYAPESLATLKYATVTLEHPPEMITPQNVEKYGKGHASERVEVNRDLVDTDLIVERQDAIDAVEKDGIRETSCGYECDIEEEIGVYNGTPYNFRQRKIRYNHVALVEKGRAGPEVRLRMDSADGAMEPVTSQAEQATSSVADSSAVPAAVMGNKGLGGMPAETMKVVISGREVDLPSDVAGVVQDMMDRYDEMRGKLYQLEESMSTKRKDQTDVDVSQPGVSPQVKVEQMGPDGRSAPAKVGAADTSGAAKAKGDAEAEEQAKKDAEEEEKKKDGDLAALKKDLDESKKKMDAMQAKIDEYSSASSNRSQKADSAEATQQAIRARVKLERQAEKVVPFEVAKKFDSMSDNEIRAAVIKHHRPKADLTSASDTYLAARFDSLLEVLEEQDDQGTETRREAGRRMLGGSTGEGKERNDSGQEPDPHGARLKMVNGGRAEWQNNLSAHKK